MTILINHFKPTLLLVTVLLFSVLTVPEVVSADADNEESTSIDPLGLLLTWQQDPTSTMTVDWHTLDDGGMTELQYKKVTSEDWENISGEQLPFPFSDRIIHRVELTGLEADTEYHFRFGENTRVRKFRTMPVDTHRPIRFAAGGDVRRQNQTNRHVAAYDPDFVVWGGDLSYADGREDRLYRWYEFMDSIMNTLITADGRMIPVLAGIGNHEVRGGYYHNNDHRFREDMPAYSRNDVSREEIAPYYYKLFAFPGQPGYGVLDFGDYMSIILLDTDHSNPIEGEQTEWLEEILTGRQDVPHIFPNYHVPAWPSVRNPGGATHTRVRENFVPLFEEFGVRVAFENHDHIYKRTYPILEGSINPKGVVYIGDGAWGVGTREIGRDHEEHAWYLKRAASERHFIIGTVNGNHQHFLVVNEDGEIIDEYPRTPNQGILRMAMSFTTPDTQNDRFGLENPMTVEYLQEHLVQEKPRLIINSEILEQLRMKLETDPVVQNMYEAIKLNADAIRKEPLLERNVIGRRLLATSREMLYRMNILGMVYLIDEDPDVLDRIHQELLAVIDFEDWNPSHFLDVGEMAMAVAIAIDWAGSDLPESTVERAKEALIEKGINPSYNPEGNIFWINADMNWNQVCHGGMVAAAIAIADKNPELAAETISRALDGMPHALDTYGPDGVYPEGPSYWNYGTSFSVVTSSMLESAFGTDFGIAEYPAFLESADFRLLSIAPTGLYYNFGDSGDRRSENGDLTLAWFAAKTGNKIYFEKERFLRDPHEMGKLSRFGGMSLVWLSQFENIYEEELPLVWKGDGVNPVVFFRGGEDDPRQYYFGGKGGSGDVNVHGNMDVGSFIFELDGVRWVIDPGNQGYHELERIGFNLWGRCQECDRWTLLTKNNFGHSTLTVNESLHKVDGIAHFTHFSDGDKPEATLDMSKVFEGQLESAQRRFVKESGASLLIEDHLELTDSTELVTWQLMTTADVIPTSEGAMLEQEGKHLNLHVLSPGNVKVSVISLDPPPLELDKRIENLKRVEIRVPAYLFSEGKGSIRVRLSSED